MDAPPGVAVAPTDAPPGTVVAPTDAQPGSVTAPMDAPPAATGASNAIVVHQSASQQLTPSSSPPAGGGADKPEANGEAGSDEPFVQSAFVHGRGAPSRRGPAPQVRDMDHAALAAFLRLHRPVLLASVADRLLQDEVSGEDLHDALQEGNAETFAEFLADEFGEQFGGVVAREMYAVLTGTGATTAFTEHLIHGEYDAFARRCQAHTAGAAFDALDDARRYHAFVEAATGGAGVDVEEGGDGAAPGSRYAVPRSAKAVRALGLKGEVLQRMDRLTQARLAFEAAAASQACDTGLRQQLLARARDALCLSREQEKARTKQFCGGAAETATMEKLLKRAKLKDKHADSLTNNERVLLLLQIVAGGDECLDVLRFASAGNAGPGRLRARVLLGRTGEGKSTFLNYINGTDYDKATKGLAPVGETEEVTRVGGQLSTTFLPTAHLVGERDIFFDCPGLGDTGGAVVAIGNAINVRNVMVGCLDLGCLERDLTIVYMIRTGKVEADARTLEFTEMFTNVMQLFPDDAAFLQFASSICVALNGPATASEGTLAEHANTYCNETGVSSAVTAAWNHITTDNLIYVDPTVRGGGPQLLERLARVSHDTRSPSAVVQAAEAAEAAAGEVTPGQRVPFKVILPDREKLLLVESCDEVDSAIAGLAGAHTTEALTLVRRNWELVKTLASIIDDSERLQKMFREKLPRVLEAYARNAFVDPLQELLRQDGRGTGATASTATVRTAPYSADLMRDSLRMLRNFDTFVAYYPEVECLSALFAEESQRCAKIRWDAFASQVGFEAPVDVASLIADTLAAPAGDVYAVLALPPTASSADVKAAYKRYAALVHPDRCKTSGAKEAFQLISNANTCLTDATARAAYDKACDAASSADAAAAPGGGGGGPGNGGQHRRGELEALEGLLVHLSQCDDDLARVFVVADANTEGVPTALRAAAAATLEHFREGTWLLDFEQISQIPALLASKFVHAHHQLQQQFGDLGRMELQRARAHVDAHADPLLAVLEQTWPKALTPKADEFQLALAEHGVEALTDVLDAILAALTTSGDSDTAQMVAGVKAAVAAFYGVANTVDNGLDAMDEAEQDKLLALLGHEEALRLAELNNRLRGVCVRGSTLATLDAAMARVDMAFDRVALRSKNWDTFGAADQDMTELETELDSICADNAGMPDAARLVKHVDSLRKRMDDWGPAFVQRMWLEQLQPHIISGDTHFALLAATELGQARKRWPDNVTPLANQLAQTMESLRKKVTKSIADVPKHTSVLHDTESYDDQFRYMREFFLTATVLRALEGTDDLSGGEIDEVAAEMKKAFGDVARAAEGDDSVVVPMLVCFYACAQVSEEQHATDLIKDWLGAMTDEVRVSRIGDGLLEHEGCIQYAAQLLDAFPQFKRMQVKLHKQYASISPDAYFDKLVAANVGNAEFGTVKARMKAIFDSYQKQSNGRVEALVDAVQSRKQDAINAIGEELVADAKSAAARFKAAATDPERDAACAELVAAVCCGRSFIDAASPGSGFLQDRTYLFECHPLQVFAVLSFFLLQRKLPDGTIPEPQYHFRSVGTGEGKSIVISAVGIMCALLGLQPDVACFSKILADRDRNNARAWQEFFEVRVQYGTIDGLIEVAKEYQAEVDPRCRQVLEGKPLKALSAAGGTKGGVRVLIIDEVDVLFSEDMVGRVWEYAGEHYHESVSQLYLDIWSGGCTDVASAMASPHGQVVKAAFPNLDLERVLEAAFPALERVRSGEFQYEVDETRQKVLRRSSVDGRLEHHVEDEDFFAALKEAAGTHPRIKLDAALKSISVRTPFAAKHALSLPRRYGAVWGVSGTLESQFFDSIADKLFHADGGGGGSGGGGGQKLPNKLVMPTSFKDKKALHEDPPIVCGGALDADGAGFDPLHPENSGYFLNIKKDIEAKVEMSRAVLVVFETAERLAAFRSFTQSRPITPATQKVKSTSALPPERVTDKYSVIDQTIKVAATRCRVTLATRTFGRGSDFVCTDALLKQKGGMHVIQTFWSLDNAEEVQIRGRTCRQDNPGSYRLILWEEDLQPYCKANGGAALNPSDPANVEAVRVAYFAGRLAQTVAAMEAAASREADCAVFLRNLHDATDYDGLVKFINTTPAVVEQGGSTGTAVTVIVACDVSGSMGVVSGSTAEGVSGRRRIDEACTGVTNMIDALKARDCPDDRLVVYAFNHEVKKLQKSVPLADVVSGDLTSALLGAVQGGTALLDGIGLPLRDLYPQLTGDASTSGACVELLVLTDGEEQHSSVLDEKKVRQLLSKPPQEGVVHTTIVSVGGCSTGMELLKRLADGLEEHVNIVGVADAAGNIETVFQQFSARVIATSRQGRAT